MEEKVIEFINEQKSKSRKFIIRELLINAVEELYGKLEN